MRPRPTTAATTRSVSPGTSARSWAAAACSGYDRQITAPTVVIHGLADKLMRPAGGRAIAEAIRGARLVLFPGMGHELPEELWDQIIAELDADVRRGRQATADALDSACVEFRMLVSVAGVSNSHRGLGSVWCVSGERGACL